MDLVNNASKVEAIHKILQGHESSMDSDLSLDSLKDEVKAALVLNEFNMQEEAMANTSKHHMYIVMLFEMKAKQSYLKRYVSVLYQLLYDFYKFEYAQNLRTKDDYHRHIYAHKTWVLLKKVQDHADQVHDYLSYVERLFGERNFSIGAVSRLMGN
jgi:hypothetical protein